MTCLRIVSFCFLEIRLNGDFNTIVTDEVQFLSECSSELENADCIAVRPGSIILTIQGSEEGINNAVTQIETNGLSLPSFGTMTG